MRPGAFTLDDLSACTAARVRLDQRLTMSEDDARRFYQEMTDAPLVHADFVAASEPTAAPQWELVVHVGASRRVVRLQR